MIRSDFSFELPSELIAEYPCENLNLSRLLCVSAQGEFSDRTFHDVAQLLRPSDLVVVNDSQIIRTRVVAYKESGGRIEVLIEQVAGRTACSGIGTSAQPAVRGWWLATKLCA